MVIAAVNENSYRDTSSGCYSKKNKNNIDSNIAETFKAEVMNWEQKNKEKIQTDLENDRKKNIKMSDKQWNALMNKVDTALNNSSQAAADKKVERNSFAEILKEKEKSQLNAKDFLSSLTADQLYAIQKANSLANQIKVKDLSDEGAENLFLRPLGTDKVVDLNNDGIEEVGEAKMVFFPPPNAPDTVKKAWEEGTADLSSEEKNKLFFKIIAKQVESNYSVGPNGTFVKHKPGEIGWKNVFGSTEDSYIDLFNSIIDRIDNPLAASDSKQKEEDQAEKKALLDVINLIKN